MGEDKKILTFILAGGKGSRLYPLTQGRAKPAVPFAGRYRIIDFVLSNCINSGLRQIYVLTQVKSLSLEEHLRAGWGFLNRDFGEFITSVPAQQQLSECWYEGTADAIFQNIALLENHRPEYVLILSGDHIYNMDYRELLQQHIATQSDLSLTVMQIDKKEAHQFGVLTMDENRRVISFQEKPQDVLSIPGEEDHCFINAGIYLFKTDALVRALSEDARGDSDHDFGKNIIPNMIGTSQVSGFQFEESRFGGYWRDVGSIQSYFQAHMEFLEQRKEAASTEDEWRLHTCGEQLMPAFFDGENVEVTNSLIGSGSHLVDCTVRNSIVGRNVKIGKGTIVEDSVIMGDSIVHSHCVIQRAVVDRDVVVMDNQQIGVDSDQDSKRFLVSDGIVVVPKCCCVEGVD